MLTLTLTREQVSDLLCALNGASLARRTQAKRSRKDVTKRACERIAQDYDVLFCEIVGQRAGALHKSRKPLAQLVADAVTLAA